jgi:hypothetical protein
MNDYEGLNLPQLLDLMHELIRPEPVSWMPQTPGWWISLAWVITVVIILSWHRYQAWCHNRYRREALAMLRSIEANSVDDQLVAGQIAILLKRTALAAYPRERVAQLYGSEWAQFLCDAASNDPIIEQTAEQLATAAYRAQSDGRALIGPARRWIKTHRA